MPIILDKGQRVSIKKGLNNLTVGLGWDPSDIPGQTFDLDASAFMLGSNGKLPNDDYFVFYNSENRVHPDNLNKLEYYNQSKYPDIQKDYKEKTMGVSPDWSVYGALDDTIGDVSDGDDDEEIQVNLSKVSDEIQEIIFVVTIHDYLVFKQKFGQVRNSYIRIINSDTNEEIMKYELDEDYRTETAIEVGRLYRRGSEWKFEAMGKGYEQDLGYFINKYN